MKYRVLTGLAAIFLTACGASAKHESTGGASTGSTSAGTGDESTSTSGTGGAEGASASTTTTSTSGSAATTSSTTSTSTSTGTTTSSSSGGSTAVTIYVTPDSSLSGTITAAIMAATKSVHMTMYILDYAPYVNALVDRKKAGLDVRVVMNQNFPTGTVETNNATYTTLTSAGIGVVWRNGPPGGSGTEYTHEKAFILDGTQAWIMTLNLDASSTRYNREYVVVDDTPADVAEADAIFLADYEGTAITAGDPLVVSPDPPCNSRTALVALIDSATKTLDVEVEEFSDNVKNGVVAAVAAAAKRGVATRVILANTTPVAAQTTAIATVKAAGAKVVVSGGTSGASTTSSPYIHAKAVTVDCAGTTCARGFLGSENFSEGALGYNRELGLIVDSAAQLAKVQAAINTDFAAGTAQ